MRDYKNARYTREQESPISSAVAALIWAGICLVLLTAPTWGPWIDEVCK